MTDKNIYNDNIENITRIDFNIYSNSDIIADSVISDVNGITIADINDNTGKPITGGVNDRRLGVTENKYECGTCGETALKCPGHFGHTKFIDPVFHIGFLLLYLKNILSCICIRCNKLLVHKNEDKIAKLLKNTHGKQRFIEIRNICKSITHCQKENYGCGTPAHKITIDKRSANIYLLAEPIKRNTDQDTKNNQEPGEKKKSTYLVLKPQMCYDILRSVSDEDCIILGFDPKKSRPEDMIICNFPIPPMQVRPSVRVEILSSSTRDDGLTHQLLGIVKTNENLKNTKGDGSLSKIANNNDDFTLLQLHVVTFYANDILGLPKSQQKNKAITKSLTERLKGKEGRIRGNLMGKRVDMSGRTVITSDPNVALNGVGIPLQIAKNLTYPEIVTKHNIDYLTQLVKNGPHSYPGANFIISTIIDDMGNENRRNFKLENTRNPRPLKIGDIVERHLVNGDIVLFNRQPSLHKLSMMGHIIHVLDDINFRTFRVNESVTDPYNADFDGDEMNIHVPQSIQTVSELRLITNVSKRFVSPATSKIAINVKQDTLMGSYLLCYDDIRVNWKDAMNILMTTSKGLDMEIPKNKILSGKYIYSQIINPGINIIRKNDNDQYSMRIINGLIMNGIFTKPEIGAIIQKTWFQYGSIDTKNFIDDLQRMILNWLMGHGFTVGIGDLIVPNNIYDSIAKLIETKRKETLFRITEYENDPYVMTHEAFETNLKASLQATQGEIEKLIMNNLDSKNGMYITISSGSNGTTLNAAQIIGCVGQVVVETKRIQNKFNNRSYPMFYQYDDSAFARGYTYNSFIKGLNLVEFFYQAMAGREGVISTAVKTADTGYIQRKLVKVLEDIKVEYDGTVRNANDKVIQILYGDNGINTEKQIEQKIGLMNANNKTIMEKYVYSDTEIKTMQKNKITEKYTIDLNKKLYEKFILMRDNMRATQRLFNLSPISFKEVYMMPIDLHQIILNIESRKNRDTDKIIDPFVVLQKIKELCSSRKIRIMKYSNDEYNIKKKDESKTKTLLKFYLYDILAPKKCTHLHKLSVSEFSEIEEYITNTIKKAIVEGGEMVGMIGAQSIGEPITQLTLKDFHKAGTGKSASIGLPRVKELLGVTRKIKTPIIRIVLEDKYKKDKNIARKIASYLKYTTLSDVIDKVDIYYDPNPTDKNSIMNKDQVTNIFANNKGKTSCQTDITNLPWIIRLTLSNEKMSERNITMLEIKSSFCLNWSIRYEEVKTNIKEYKKVIDKITQCAIISNYDNSDIPIIHIRFDANNYNFNTLFQFQEMIITKYKIKGIPGILESNNIQEESYIDFDNEGNKIVNKQYVIITDGINLSGITQIHGIDLAKTICNNLVIIYETYGVEAARLAFIKEITIAIESSGSFSNYQHIELLADAITHMGGLIAVNRHGANKLDTDPFSRASFEKTVEQMLVAATFSESDHIRSVSSRIMVGSLINGGTGCFDLMLDHNKLKEYLKPTRETETFVLKKNSLIKDLIKK